MTKSARRSGFWANFRKFFGRGLAILLPTVLTLWLLWHATVFVFATVAEPINRGIRLVTMRVMPDLFVEEGRPSQWWNISQPDWWRVDPPAILHYQAGREQRGLLHTTDDVAIRDIRRERFRELWSQHWYLEGTGLAVAIALIYVVGLLMTNFLGRAIYTTLEKWMTSVPVIKQVYPHVKQAVDMVMGEKRIAFKRVVLVQYPRQGLWTVGLVTSEAFREARRVAGSQRVLSVFIPSSPTPFTGYIINVPADEVMDTDVTIDQALRFVVTGGLLTPDDRPPAAQARRGDPADPTPPP